MTAWPPTIHRMTGSRLSRSASFTSSYPPRRPKTDWRNCATRPWRPFFPRRVSVSTSPAISLSPTASSSSCEPYGNNAGVGSDLVPSSYPWNSSLSRRSKSSHRQNRPLSIHPSGEPYQHPFIVRDHCSNNIPALTNDSYARIEGARSPNHKVIWEMRACSISLRARNVGFFSQWSD